MGLCSDDQPTTADYAWNDAQNAKRDNDTLKSLVLRIADQLAIDYSDIYPPPREYGQPEEEILLGMNSVARIYNDLFYGRFRRQ